MITREEAKALVWVAHWKSQDCRKDLNKAVDTIFDSIEPNHRGIVICSSDTQDLFYEKFMEAQRHGTCMSIVGLHPETNKLHESIIEREKWFKAELLDEEVCEHSPSSQRSPEHHNRVLAFNKRGKKR